MSESKKAESAMGFERCSRCGAFGSVRTWQFGYGTRSRIDQRTGNDIDGYVGTDSIALCAACQRRLLWVGIGRFTSKHARTFLLPLLLIASSFAIHGWFPELVLNTRVLLPLAVGAGYAVYLSFLLSRDHAPTLRQLFLELRRHELAAKSELPEASLVAYPPR